MPLIRDGAFADDPWVALDDESPLPGDRDVIVSLDRLKAESGRIAGRNGRTGVALPNDADPREIADLLAHLDLVALHFPAFTDGRAYSQARQLRIQLGFAGELRATGNVLADQAAFMLRVGFDSFEVGDDVSPETWNRAASAMSLAYQRGYDARLALRKKAPPSNGKGNDTAPGQDAALQSKKKMEMQT